LKPHWVTVSRMASPPARYRRWQWPPAASGAPRSHSTHHLMASRRSGSHSS